MLRACIGVWVCCVGQGNAVEAGRTEVLDGERSASARRAAEWGITEADWTRYEGLMRGRRGLWTPAADPLLVLGAHARTAAERRRFAEAFVLAEHARVVGELAFERAVQAAWARLFPGQPRLAPPPVVAMERYAVLVDRECADCDRLVRRYARGAVPVDIYVRGAVDDADLRGWVAEHELAVEAIAAGEMTVNHLPAGGTRSVPGVWGRGAAGTWTAVE